MKVRVVLEQTYTSQTEREIEIPDNAESVENAVKRALGQDGVTAMLHDQAPEWAGSFWQVFTVDLDATEESCGGLDEEPIEEWEVG